MWVDKVALMVIDMNIRKSLEKPTLIAGVEMGDLVLFLITGFGFVIVLSIMRTFLPIPSWVNIVLLGILAAGFIALRKMTAKKHATFLKSLIFWYLSAPKKVEMSKPKLLREYQSKCRTIESLNRKRFKSNQ
jgi:hypothetical protein